MSTIVAPYPPHWYRTDHTPAPGARWWRLVLRPNEDNNLMIMRTDATDLTRDATWVSWEFFDGTDTMIDAGLDKPSVEEVRATHREADNMYGRYDTHLVCVRPPVTVLDILSIEQPTPSPWWCPMTMPGDHTHPEDRPSLSPWPRLNRGGDPICTPTRAACLGY